MLAPVLGVLAMLASALTVWFARTRPATDEDPDARFWYVFTGACVLAPLLLGAAALGPWTGVAVLAAAAGTVLASDRFSSATLRRRLASAERQLLVAEHSALAGRHDAVLKAWARYELDPGAAIDHPGMNDMQLPATSALAKALAVAEGLRDPAHGGVEGGGAGAVGARVSGLEAARVERYRQAVSRLESAFRQAELAAARMASPCTGSPHATGSAAGGPATSGRPDGTMFAPWRGAP